LHLGNSITQCPLQKIGQPMTEGSVWLTHQSRKSMAYLSQMSLIETQNK